MDDYLKNRWVGHEEKLENLVSIIKVDADWHKSEVYKALMDGLGPIPTDIVVVEKDMRGAPLSNADLEKATLSEASLWGANLSQASLRGANLSGANLIRANLSGADLWGARYTTDEIFNQLMKWWVPRFLHHIPFVKGMKILQKWKPVGITNFTVVDTTKVDGSTNPVLKRHIEDYQFILGFKEKSWFHRKLFYPIWKVTSDCGRSLSLWLISSMIVLRIFTVIYSFFLNDWFNQPLNLFDIIYFNVVTLTTLGFGDITPKVGKPIAQLPVMIEVVIGYIMFGGLVSILANKLARRA